MEEVLRMVGADRPKREEQQMVEEKQEMVTWKSKSSDNGMDVPRPLYDAVKNLAEVAVVYGVDEGEEARKETSESMMDVLFHLTCSSAIAFVSVNTKGSIMYEGLCSASPERFAELEELKKSEPGELMVSAVGMYAHRMKDQISKLESASRELHPRVMGVAMSMDPSGTMASLIRDDPAKAVAFAAKLGLSTLTSGECDCVDCKAKREGGTEKQEATADKENSEG